MQEDKLKNLEATVKEYQSINRDLKETVKINKDHLEQVLAEN